MVFWCNDALSSIPEPVWESVDTLELATDHYSTFQRRNIRVSVSHGIGGVRIWIALGGVGTRYTEYGSPGAKSEVSMMF